MSTITEINKEVPPPSPMDGGLQQASDGSRPAHPRPLAPPSSPTNTSTDFGFKTVYIIGDEQEIFQGTLDKMKGVIATPEGHLIFSRIDTAHSR